MVTKIRCPYCNDDNMPMPKRTVRPFGKCPDCGKKSRAAISDGLGGKVYVSYHATSLPKLETDEIKRSYSVRLSKRDIMDIEQGKKFLEVSNGRLRLQHKL